MNTIAAWTEAGRLVARSEKPRDRAIRLLTELVPRFNDRDAALENLYYIDPNATPAIRLLSIAAALHIMATDHE